MVQTFRALTTMRVGGPIREFVEATDTGALVDFVRAADARNVPLLIMGGGSNLVVSDAGWDGLTVRVASQGIDIDGTTVRADAGVNWDRLVALTLEEGLAGIEALSAIPGSVGATPVQNVGAYGALTSDVLSSVLVYDRESSSVEEWGRERCGFGSHRQSVFKHTDRYLVLQVTYELRRSSQSAPIRFGELARRLDVGPGGTADVGDVRREVIALRRQRGSVLDDDDPDTWGVGSFFINPVLRTVPEAARDSPMYPDPLGTKLPAGWLVEQAGFPPGYGRDWGSGTVALSSKHALAISNRGGATTQDVMRFAKHIRSGVEQRFQILLGPECHLVGCSLDD